MHSSKYSKYNTGMKKSLITAYALWFFGGFTGLYHVYLDRISDAFYSLLTFGGLGISWFIDFFYLPQYVREANWMDDEEYLHQFSAFQKCHKKPKIRSSFFSKVFGGLLASFAFSCLAPEDSTKVIVMALETIGTTIGVYFGGSSSKTKHSSASFTKMLACGGVVKCIMAGLDYLELFEPDVKALEYSTIACVITNCITFFLTRHWTVQAEDVLLDLKSRPIIKRKFKGRTGCEGMTRFALVFLLLNGLVMTGLVQHGRFNMVDLETGESVEYTVRDCLKHMLNSPILTEMESTFWSIYEEAKTGGFSAGWEHIKVKLDPDGSLRAYKDLGLNDRATLGEIKHAYRKLVLKYHPDKFASSNEKDKQRSKERFLRIQEAYELLATSKRHRKSQDHDEL